MSTSGGQEGAASVVTNTAAGAATGFAVGGPVGAVVGGVIGFVSGVIGFGCSQKRRKAAKLKRQVRAINNVLLRRQAIVEYIAASAVSQVGIIGSGAGTGRSSGGFGVQASARTQVKSNLKVNRELYRRGEKIGKLEQQAASKQMISEGIMSAYQGVGGAYGAVGLDKPPVQKAVPKFSVNQAGEFVKSFPG